MKFLPLFLLFGVVLSASALDRHALTITRYDLEARVEPEQQRLAVRGKITVRNDSDSSQKNITLQISSTLNWLSIQFEGKPLDFTSQTYTSDVDHSGALTEAILVLPHPLARNQSLDLQIAYEGIIPQDTTRLTRIGVPADTAKHSDWDQISRDFAVVRGIGYVAWYPISTEAVSLSEGDSVFEEIGHWKQRESDSEMKVNLCISGATTSLSAFMNDSSAPGESETSKLGSSSTVCADHSFPHLGNTVPLFVLSNYQTNDRPNAAIHYLPNHKSGADDYVLALDEVSPVLELWFGKHAAPSSPKPQLLDLPDLADSPYESGNTLLMPFTDVDTTLLLSAIRQLTRANFPSPRLWISEGLPGYAQTAYMEKEKGRPAALAYLQGHRSALVTSEKENQSSGDEKAAADHSLINDADDFFIETKAMNIWWMLRDIVGEKALNAALQNYQPSADTSAYYMQKLIEAQAHRDLGWFFDDWIYRDRGLPDFRIVSVYPRQLVSGGFMVTVTVENLGEASAEVPVTLHMAEGITTERLLVPGKSKASIRIVAPMLPQTATVNDGSVPETGTTNNEFKIPPPNE